MKKLLLLLFICPIVSFSQSFHSNSYKEFNIGIYSGINYIPAFPGASFLFGKTNYYQNNTLLDYQVGVAFPSIVTGKFGFGFGDENYATIFGIRPFPTSTYIQFSFNEKNNMSFEYVLPDLFETDMLEKGIIITYGYRF